MKTLILALLFCSTTQAAEFKFLYKMNGKTLEIKMEGKTWEQAFERAAGKCVQFFRKDKPMNEDFKLDIIDVCANPR